jgi:N-acyl homoserine lactone hydrolase
VAGLRLTVVDAGPLRPDKNKLVAFAPGGPVSVPTTVGIIEHPKHGLILWDTGINDIVADPERGEAYWGRASVMRLARTGSPASTRLMPN